jgi:hypothetical protein
MVAELTGRMALQASNDAGRLVLRREVAVLRRQNPWRAISYASNAR